MRKTLGILNLVAGVLILSGSIFLWRAGVLLFTLQTLKYFSVPILNLLAIVTSLASGISVLKGKGEILVILAAVNLIFAIFMIMELIAIFFLALAG